MTRVLMFIGHYLPARRVGGPARSVASMVASLPEVEFHVFTSDTDFKSPEVLEGIQPDRWQGRGRAQVFYASARNRTPWAIRRIVRQARPDLIYLHSYFARRFTQSVLLLRRLGFLRNIPVILALRGEFSLGALQLKSRKKRLYRVLARWLGLYRGLVWHACSSQEVADIRRVLGPSATIVEAPNFPPEPVSEALDIHREKVVHQARLVFLSRISPMKNLLGVIEILSQVQEPVVFDVYGPVEDAAYWVRCQQAARNFPGNVTMTYRGEVEPGGAERVFAGYDALFLPTLGENYGHVIPEAWAAAMPVVISDRTPWTDLETKLAGWVVPLDDRAAFVERIEALARMEEHEHARWRAGAYAYSIALFRDEALLAAYRRLFATALQMRRVK